MSESDLEEFEAALATALPNVNVPTLQMLTVQLTGDERWLLPPFEPTRCKGIDDNDTGGYSLEMQDEIRSAAFRAIIDWRTGKPIAIPEIPTDMLLRMMRVSVGEEIPADYADLMAAKLQAYTHPRGRSLESKVPEDFTVLVIGAGMSGIAMGVKLQDAGIPFQIVDKGSEVGGVWNQNHYPGCGVDTPSHLYSYSFARGNWTRYFPSRDEVRENFRKVARESGIRDRMRFDTEVVATRYDETEQRWYTELQGPEGHVETVVSRVVISAVGAFGQPKWPDIAGLKDFQGTIVHTGQWDQDLDLEGKRVGVIGNGASAMQLVPAIADRVRSMTVYQRSKQWAAPFPKLHQDIPNGVRFLISEVPLYEWWYRLRLSWIFDSKVYASLHKDPDWEDPDRSLNAINDGHRRFFTRYIEKELGDRQDLAPRVVPDFPPYGKRMLLDNGWFRTLTRPHVELVDSPIEHVDATGINNADGTHRELDVIVIASGFDVARFLSPVNVYGRDGTSVREAWQDDDPKAFLGTVTPGFPNFFMLFGPNTSLGHGGSFIFITECQINYVMSVLENMFDASLTEVEVREDVSDEYNDTMDRLHQDMVWTHPGMSTYYRNSHGRVVVNSPWSTVEYWRFTKEAAMSHFVTKRGDQLVHSPDADGVAPVPGTIR